MVPRGVRRALKGGGLSTADDKSCSLEDRRTLSRGGQTLTELRFRFLDFFQPVFTVFPPLRKPRGFSPLKPPDAMCRDVLLKPLDTMLCRDVRGEFQGASNQSTMSLRGARLSTLRKLYFQFLICCPIERLRLSA